MQPVSASQSARIPEKRRKQSQIEQYLYKMESKMEQKARKIALTVQVLPARSGAGCVIIQAAGRRHRGLELPDRGRSLALPAELPVLHRRGASVSIAAGSVRQDDGRTLVWTAVKDCEQISRTCRRLIDQQSTYLSS